MSTETATFGAGCFWGVEYVFERVPGVVGTEVGYAGGHTENPTYRDVCSHGTGHAEVLRVEFDPSVVSFEQLLEVFWAMHDPTQVEPPGAGRRRPVPERDLHELGRAAAGRRGLARRGAGAVRPADRDRDHARRTVLPGGGLPPAVLRQERARAVLPRDPVGHPARARPREGRRVAEPVSRPGPQGPGRPWPRTRSRPRADRRSCASTRSAGPCPTRGRCPGGGRSARPARRRGW